MLGVKDLDRKILLELDDRSLFNACQIDTRYRKICNDDTFWRIRYIQRFGVRALEVVPKPSYDDSFWTWKRHYLDAVIDLENFPGIDKLSEKIAWDTQGNWETSSWVNKFIDFPFEKAPTRTKTWFFLKRIPEIMIEGFSDFVKLNNVTPEEIYLELSKLWRNYPKTIISKIDENPFMVEVYSPLFR